MDSSLQRVSSVRVHLIGFSLIGLELHALTWLDLVGLSMLSVACTVKIYSLRVSVKGAQSLANGSIRLPPARPQRFRC